MKTYNILSNQASTRYCKQLSTILCMQTEKKKWGKQLSWLRPKTIKVNEIISSLFPNIQLKPEVFTAEIHVNTNKLIVI